MDEKPSKADLLEKYMNNSCTKQEFEKLMELIKTSQDFESFDAPMKKYWENAGRKPLPHVVDWARISSNIKLKLWALKKTKVQFKYAAIIVLAVTAFTFLLYRNANIDPTLYLTQHSGIAKTKTVLLSDGTRVTLNANSDLRYPQSFNGKTREVYLKGEAYFQVVHNVSKPFIIHSGKLKTQVLGTTFTVNAYSQVKPMNVTVLTGKVAVKYESTQALAILTRGQSATIEANKKTFALTSLANPEDAIAWMEDKLIFDNADLEDVALKLSNKYGVVVKITGNKLPKQRITAIFQGQNLPGILNAITKLTHSGYTVQDSTYVLY